jgi:hypothetical protein
MENRGRLISICKNIVEDFFPDEVIAFELFADESIDKLNRGVSIVDIDKKTQAKFEAGHSLTQVLNFLSILQATYETAIKTETNENLNIDISQVFTNELVKAGVKKKMSIEISLKYKEHLDELAENGSSYSITEIQKNISKGETEKAMSKLEEMIKDKSHIHEFSLISSKFYTAKNQYRKGIIDITLFNQNTIEVNHSLLNLVQLIEIE